MIPNLTIRQLQTFREVMRAGSISEASRTLGRTQPAVSTMIAGIERELGFALFLREHGRLVPCPEAHYFLEEANEVLERLDRAARTMSEFTARQRGSIRIACHPAASGHFLPGLLAGFLRGRDEVRADLMMRSSHVVEDLIASQEYDIGLAETPRPRASVRLEIFDPACLIALPAGHPLCRHQVITPGLLGPMPMATLFDEHSIYEATAAAFNDAGVVLNRRFVLRTFLPALRLVEAGLCACLVDAITAASAPAGGIEFKRFEPRIISSISILLPAHKPVSRLTAEFHNGLRRELQRLVDLETQGV